MSPTSYQLLHPAVVCINIQNTSCVVNPSSRLLWNYLFFLTLLIRTFYTAGGRGAAPGRPPLQPTPKDSMRKYILISNDDGINAPGIGALAAACTSRPRATWSAAKKRGCGTSPVTLPRAKRASQPATAKARASLATGSLTGRFHRSHPRGKPQLHQDAFSARPATWAGRCSIRPPCRVVAAGRLVHPFAGKSPGVAGSVVQHLHSARDQQEQVVRPPRRRLDGGARMDLCAHSA